MFAGIAMKLYQSSYAKLVEMRPNVKFLSTSAILTDYHGKRVEANSKTEFVCKWVTYLTIYTEKYVSLYFVVCTVICVYRCTTGLVIVHDAVFHAIFILEFHTIYEVYIQSVRGTPIP